MFSAIFGHPTAEKVLLYIANYGEGHTRAISSTFDLSTSQVYQQLIRLEKEGVLVAKQTGRTKVFTFNPRLAIRKPLLNLLEEILLLMPSEDQKKYFRDRTRPRKTGKALCRSQQRKNFFHSETDLSVEFPTGPIGIGDRVPVKPEGKIKVGKTEVILLSPTQSVMDRLAWFYFNNDRQCLDQAVMIALKQPISLKEIEEWSAEEQQQDKYSIFIKTLKARRK